MSFLKHLSQGTVIGQIIGEPNSCSDMHGLPPTSMTGYAVGYRDNRRAKIYQEIQQGGHWPLSEIALHVLHRGAVYTQAEQA